MQSKPAKEHFIDLSKQNGEMGREDCQEGWHRLVYNLIKSKTIDVSSVLDVGAGLGLSEGRIPFCVTQDPGCTRSCLLTPIERLNSKSYDMVTAFDVIEHVVEDIDFSNHLVRIARKYVFITTPNLEISHAANGCHCREYSPREFFKIASSVNGWGIKKLWSGDGTGWFPVDCTYRQFVNHYQPHHAALLEIK